MRFLILAALLGFSLAAHAATPCADFSGTYLSDMDVVHISQDKCASITYTYPGGKTTTYPLDGTVVSETYTDGMGGKDSALLQNYIFKSQITTVGTLTWDGPGNSPSTKFVLVTELLPSGDIQNTVTLGDQKPVVTLLKKIN